METGSYAKKIVALLVLISLAIMTHAMERRNPLRPKEITISSFDDLKTIITQRVTQGSLVVFDIDLVLVQENLIMPFIKKQIETYAQHGAITRMVHRYATLNFKQNIYQALTNDQFPDFIAQLRERGAKVICLTNSFVGPVGTIKSYPALRIQKLQELGLNFEDAFPRYNGERERKLPFEQETTPSIRNIKERCALFRSGILFSNGYPKGIVLQRCLDLLAEEEEYQPHNIIFIDDKKYNAISVIADTNLPEGSICILYTEPKTNKNRYLDRHYEELREDALWETNLLINQIEVILAKQNHTTK